MNRDDLDTVSRALHMLGNLYQVYSRALGHAEGFSWCKRYARTAVVEDMLDSHSKDSYKLALKYQTLALVTHDRILNHEESRI